MPTRYGPANLAGFGLANEGASETGYSAPRNILDGRELVFRAGQNSGHAMTRGLFALVWASWCLPACPAIALNAADHQALADLVLALIANAQIIRAHGRHLLY